MTWPCRSGRDLSLSFTESSTHPSYWLFLGLGGEHCDSGEHRALPGAGAVAELSAPSQFRTAQSRESESCATFPALGRRHFRACVILAGGVAGGLSAAELGELPAVLDALVPRLCQ